MDEQIKLIAQRLKDLREICDVSAQEAAEDFNIPLETYLNYESGNVDIPLSLLYEAANKFKVDLTEILSGVAPKLNSYQLVKAGKGLDVKRREQYKYQNLAFNFSNKKIEPFLVEVPFLGDDSEIHYNSHPGQEFNYVISGKLVISIDGKDIELSEGDSLYFNSLCKHGMKAVGGQKAKFLAIILE